MRKASMDVSYFDDLYATSGGDPWRFATSDYEAQKYRATLDALPRATYRRALEVGCSIGILTRQLATRCDTLVATEPARSALAQARTRCADQPNVAFLPLTAPAEWPEGSFDLIILSEVVYYMTREQVHALAGAVLRTLEPEGEVELVHWTGETDYPLSADDAVECFLAACGDALETIRQERTADYRLDLLRRATAPSAGGSAR